MNYLLNLLPPMPKDQVRKKVGYILEKYPATRNCDKELCRQYRMEYDGLRDGVNRENFQRLTSTATITRARRWYNAYPRMLYLATDPAVLRTRKQAKHEYAQYYASISNITL